MSHILIDRSPDLKRLRNEGYEIQILNGHLLVHQIPYVNHRKEIAYGTLVTPLGDLAGNKTVRPHDHVIYFSGDHPCSLDGNILTGIQHISQIRILADGVSIDHSFSSKPPIGYYSDYYEKLTTYLKIIESQAQAIDSTVTSRTFKPIESSRSITPFKYIDTNSSRAEIEMLSAKFQLLKIAIIGLGGTGSYVLDYVSKTPVKEIHLFDADDFLSHNSFRAPGAASIDILDTKPKKVDYLYTVYSNMHTGITPHAYHLTSDILDELTEMSFVFICIDDGESKRLIVQKLRELKIPFIDSGVDVLEVDGALLGSARVTLASQNRNGHIEKYVSFSDEVGGDYSRNIQIAEINSINAALAVIKWKKLLGFYHDLENEHHSVFDISMNKLINDESNS